MVLFVVRGSLGTPQESKRADLMSAVDNMFCRKVARGTNGTLSAWEPDSIIPLVH